MRPLLAVTLISTITFTALTNWAECVAGDCVNGVGSWFGAGGNKYVGEFKNGLPHRQGTMVFADGGRYSGEYKEGKMHGQGSLTLADGSKYMGEWKEALRHGRGIWVGANGDKYVGDWQNGTQHGRGTWTLPNGKEISGIWDGFLLVEIQSDLEEGRKVIDTCGEPRSTSVEEMADSITLIE